MRPLTAVVLSDYGRDRLAYQGFEPFFHRITPAPFTDPEYLHSTDASGLYTHRLALEQIESDEDERRKRLDQFG